MTDNWSFWEGKSKYPGICEVCGQVVEKDVFYLGRRKMHAACYAEYRKQERIAPDQAELPAPSANAAKTLASAASSASPPESVPDYQLLDERTVKALEQIGAEISEVCRAIKEQTAFLSTNSVKTNEVK